MIDLVITHLTHPWCPPWTLETLGDPWRLVSFTNPLAAGSEAGNLSTWRHAWKLPFWGKLPLPGPPIYQNIVSRNFHPKPSPTRGPDWHFRCLDRKAPLIWDEDFDERVFPSLWRPSPVLWWRMISGWNCLRPPSPSDVAAIGNAEAPIL